jgi:phage shock protein PspC (stress-responsive transcriptional regulator)
MKKIININLSGRVIPIEDSAYETLQSYIESLRRYFAKEEGRDEIINDIESRIAELMNEKVRKGASSITDADVDEIATSMGRPEDFEAADAEEAIPNAPRSEGNDSSYTYTGTKKKGRLYRDSSDKIIGGVCSGIANYLNIDPAIVRILFAIITFGGFGLGILGYIILWIVLPSKDLEGFFGKRLYRNPDDKVIGGVAGGLAAYFNRKASTIRLIFAAPFLLGIVISILNRISNGPDNIFFPDFITGSLTGTFILAYVILWMVLPEAGSDYEKMEMRGEKVDVNTIRQNVREGMENVKGRMKEWSGEVKESAQNLGNKARDFANTRGKAFASDAGHVVRRTGGGLGHAIGVLFKVFFLFIAGTIAFALFVGLIVLIFGGIAWWPINNFLWTSRWQQLYAWGTLIFFLGIPLIAIITWVVRRILRVKSRHSYLGWTFGGLWVIGWIAASLFAASLSRDLRNYDHIDTTINITQPLNDKVIVTVTEPELEFTGNFGWFSEGGEGWDLSEDSMKLSSVRFNYEKSDDSLYHVVMQKWSAGRTRREAMDRADRIQYKVAYNDSVLDLGSGYSIDKESKFRGQKIDVVIKVPVGKKIRFDRSLENKLNPFHIRVDRRNHWRKRNFEFYSDDRDMFPWEPDTDYIMTNDGELQAVGEKSGMPSNYRYTPGDSIELEKTIEQKKNELKQLEEKRKRQEVKTTVQNKKKVTAPIKEGLAGSPTSVFSLVEWL